MTPYPSAVMKNSDKIEWIWFDLDDTLFDFHANSRHANRLIHSEEGIDRLYPDVEAWIKDYEAHNRILWERYSLGEISQDFLRVDRFAHLLRPLWQGSDSKLEAYARHLDTAYLQRLAEGKALIGGAKEILDYLRGMSFKIGILSNGFKGVQQAKLSNTGLDKYIDLIVLSDDIGVNKPDLRIYNYAMERSGNSNPAAHLMIGDNLLTDIAGAVKAGWSAILLSPSRQSPTPQLESPLNNGDYLVINHLSELKTLFE